MPTCFVIMPYGGRDEQRRRHFAGVYQSIILPAATQAGYTAKRSDIAGEPGNITNDIIQDLYNSDIVIADLTDANPNVFFELGIRHVVRKSGTVHIIDRNHSLPFDVRAYRAVQYSTELADLPGVADEIVAAIRKRASQPERSDNPVHDAIPTLPGDLRATGDPALRLEHQRLQETITALQTENDSFQSRLAALDPGGTLRSDEPEVNVGAILDHADEVMRSTGRHALLRLRESVERGGVAAFVKELRVVLESPYLDLNDFLEIRNTCAALGLPEHLRATLEVARQRLPASDEILLALADAYDDSPDLQTREHGRLMLEQYLGVTRKDGIPAMAGRPPEKAINGLGLLFNSYDRLQKHEWVVSLAASAETLLGADSLIVRNKARALAGVGKPAEAETEFRRAISLDSSDDTAHAFYAEFLDDQGRYKEALEEAEAAVFGDPDDGSRYVNLAIHILNRGFVHNEDRAVHGPLPRRDRVKVAIPLLIRALEDRRRIGILRPRIVGILVRADAVAAAQAFANETIPEGTHDASELQFLQFELGRRGSTE